MIRVVIAEEHTIERWALAQALAKAGEIEVVGDAGTVDDTLRRVREVRPDVLVLDTTMPDHAGFDVLTQIREIATGPLVVVLSPIADPGYAARAMIAGAHAYVGKDEEPQRLVDAIHAVTRGEQLVPPEAQKILAAGDRHPPALTARELQVMEMLARGMTNREIAQDLEISVKTVDTHRGHVLKKLELRNNVDLTRFAVKRGYVTL